jgi:hypothetical protein
MARSWIRSRGTTLTVAALAPVLALGLTACGGSSSTATVAGATPNAGATGAPGGNGQGAGRGFGGADFAKMQACLKAAGIAVPTRSDFPRPSGSFTRPSGAANGTPPSGAAGGRGGGGGMGGLFSSPEAQAALKACGITVPTGRARASASATN